MCSLRVQLLAEIVPGLHMASWLSACASLLVAGVIVKVLPGMQTINDLTLDS